MKLERERDSFKAKLSVSIKKVSLQNIKIFLFNPP